MSSDDWGTELPTATDDGFGSAEYGFDDDIDVGEVDGSKLGSGALKVDRKGWYHFLITATARPKPYQDDDMSKLRKPSISLKMEVLASDNGTPAGAIHYHDLILGGKGPGAAFDQWDRERTLNFLVGAGILQKQGDKVIDPETGTTKIRTSTLEKRLNGLHVIGKLELTPANPKKDRSGNAVIDDAGKPVMYPERIEFNFGRGVFPVTAKEVAHVKCDEAALKADGIVRGAAKPNV